MRMPVLLRRFAAFVTLACFFGLPAESLVADVHDAALHEDGASLRQDLLASPLASQTPALSAATSAGAARTDHATHVDHCAHGHGPALAVATDMHEVSLDSRDAAPIAAEWIRSLTTQPAQRPPTV